MADTRTLDLPVPFDPAHQRVQAGMYLIESGVPELFGSPIDITDRIERQCKR
jgi:hypothetical protein